MYNNHTLEAIKERKIMCHAFKFILASLLVFVMSQASAGDLKAIEQTISDSVITTKITAKITESKQLNPFKISVSTDKGIVTLRGHVNDRKAYVEALRLVKKTAGVKGIESEGLDVKRVNTAFTDAYITAKVEAAILKAKVIDDESIPLVGINAKTENGVVTLTGHVKKQESISVINKRTSALRGVKSVISHLKVG